ncbi:GTP-binding protein [Babesia caballi]|uniref:GTP-binding protein n=1 Tax=Babesia caballi TaxID=5871 RepID=A0AAV4LVW3_BABCB|nr:GTP-binding protein [Babesia caballi]
MDVPLATCITVTPTRNTRHPRCRSAPIRASDLEAPAGCRPRSKSTSLGTHEPPPPPLTLPRALQRRRPVLARVVHPRLVRVARVVPQERVPARLELHVVPELGERPPGDHPVQPDLGHRQLAPVGARVVGADLVQIAHVAHHCPQEQRVARLQVGRDLPVRLHPEAVIVVLRHDVLELPRHVLEDEQVVGRGRPRLLPHHRLLRHHRLLVAVRRPAQQPELRRQQRGHHCSRARRALAPPRHGISAVAVDCREIARVRAPRRGGAALQRAAPALVIRGDARQQCAAPSAEHSQEAHFGCIVLLLGFVSQSRVRSLCCFRGGCAILLPRRLGRSCAAAAFCSVPSMRRRPCSRRPSPQRLQHRLVGVERYRHAANLGHVLLPLHNLCPATATTTHLRLVVQQLLLARRVPPAAPLRDVLAKRRDARSRNHPLADGRLQVNLELLRRDHLLQRVHQQLPRLVGVLPRHYHRQARRLVAVDDHAQLAQVDLPVDRPLVVEGPEAVGHGLEVVEEGRYDLDHRDLVLERDRLAPSELGLALELAAHLAQQTHDLALAVPRHAHRDVRPRLLRQPHHPFLRPVRRVADGDLLPVLQVAEVGHGGRGHHHPDVVLALQPLHRHVQVQQPVEPALEAVPRDAGLARLVHERVVVELQLLKGGAQLHVVRAVAGVEPREDRGLRRLEGHQGRDTFASPRRLQHHRVAHRHLARVLGVAAEPSHFARTAEHSPTSPLTHRNSSLSRRSGIMTPTAVTFASRSCPRNSTSSSFFTRPSTTCRPCTPSAPPYPHVADHPAVRVVLAVEHQRPERLFHLYLRRRHTLHDRVQDLRDPEPLLRRRHQDLLLLEVEQRLEVGCRGFEVAEGHVDLVDHRHKLQSLFDCYHRGGHCLRLYALGPVDHQDGSVARRDRPTRFVVEVDVAAQC